MPMLLPRHYARVADDCHYDGFADCLAITPRPDTPAADIAEAIAADVTMLLMPLPLLRHAIAIADYCAIFI